ncbi:hypothetical protein [Streptomyces cacaoi]|uniref:hypothetical protein n=1 Tax=Streptomyces cacaoi TaxID=1898 RepID=UPI003749527D
MMLAARNSVGGMLGGCQASRSVSKLALVQRYWKRKYPSGTISRARASRMSRIQLDHVVPSASCKFWKSKRPSGLPRR